MDEGVGEDGEEERGDACVAGVRDEALPVRLVVEVLLAALELGATDGDVADGTAAAVSAAAAAAESVAAAG